MKQLAVVLALVALGACSKPEQKPAAQPQGQVTQDTSHMMMMTDTSKKMMMGDTSKKMAPAAPQAKPAPKKP